MEEEWDDIVKEEMKHPYTIYYWKKSCTFRVVKKTYKGIKTDENGKKIRQYGEEILCGSEPEKASHQSLNIPDTWNAKYCSFGTDGDEAAKKSPIYFIFMHPQILEIV